MLGDDNDDDERWMAVAVVAPRGRLVIDNTKLFAVLRSEGFYRVGFGFLFSILSPDPKRMGWFLDWFLKIVL